MSTQYASKKRALAECDICGFRYKLKVLKELEVKHRQTNILACPECWNPDHPQNHLGEFPVYDPQGIRNPRSDSAGYAESRAQYVQVGPLEMTLTVIGGTVVTT